ncbi:hypothetical protein FDH96_gp084 [Mycobacterium phage Rey]|uniref:dATP/dGTP diphosphohydrolase N-terminal domain-containing protein n=1 Tax=Mycobacterium phage Rey TaxID=1034115 RepID=G1D5E6_9CAUD|nr:hypothetical protein FDH96_gp084 [Mycobacterium phage Rey]AEK09995.1 hypothetical protein PBI_REY_84 [Mycobacterium phage Rey]
MSAGEVITTSSTGAQKAGNLERFDLIPVEALRELAEHFGRGALKYADRNWEKGYEWGKSYAALCRHLTQFWAGEDIDPETGSKHIIAVAWHAFVLATFMDRYPEFDDRAVVGAKIAVAMDAMAGGDPRETTTLEPEWTRKYEWCVNNDRQYPYVWRDGDSGEGWYYEWPAKSGEWTWSTENVTPGNNLGQYDRFTRV